MELVGNIKNYDWGKLGSSSEVAKLAELNSQDFVLKPEVPYAELWMGDHPSGPSIIKANGKELGKVLAQKLPFLFKVLSIRKALSIQVHPNKAEAERLHKERPDVYQDPNHKPELAIALTAFSALCGFRPYAEIYNFCLELPPLKLLLGDGNVARLKNGTAQDLRNCYEKLMTSTNEDTARCIDDILKNYTHVLTNHKLLDTFTTVNQDFPQDVGLLSLFFLNLLKLQPGQAIFLGANEIHAYLSGDCIEAMACSDNVIRAGLTPKYKDVAQLISCLNYTGSPGANKIFQPHRIDEHVQIFVPPVNDFSVTQLRLNACAVDYQLQVQPSGSILLVLHGERTLRLRDRCDLSLSRGSIVYIPPEAAPEIEFLLRGDDRNDFVAYIATTNCFKN